MAVEEFDAKKNIKVEADVNVKFNVETDIKEKIDIKSNIDVKDDTNTAIFLADVEAFGKTTFTKVVVVQFTDDEMSSTTAEAVSFTGAELDGKV